MPTVLTPVGGDDSDYEEEVDSNNDGGSLQSERTDKDDDAGEGKTQDIQSWAANCSQATDKRAQKLHLSVKMHTHLCVCSLEKVTLSGTMRETFQL